MFTAFSVENIKTVIKKFFYEIILIKKLNEISNNLPSLWRKLKKLKCNLISEFNNMYHTDRKYKFSF